MGFATLALLVVGLGLVWTAPADFQQGYSVRILYIHVPAAKMALLSYVILTIASIGVLWKGSERMDIIAESMVAIGAAFTATTLLSGAIWGKPMWGTWWAWDARLTSMLVLLIIYVGLMALRGAFDDPKKAAKATAVMAIIGAVDLPIIHFSVKWWRTLHQPPSFDGASGMIHIDKSMLAPLGAMVAGFLLLIAYMLVVRYRTIKIRRELDELDQERMD
uniref:Heme exporter protein C n=1 Tax=Magnetococcus massalia (strain MO-1) TaxID=451514 RepID=A0A1S7LLR8_MAGMO|nr:Cytochrome c-type biogenesis protein CcmC [Candidatus Magnetococcus massalia]